MVTLEDHVLGQWNEFIELVGWKPRIDLTNYSEALQRAA
jgi:hypothetical protein